MSSAPQITRRADIAEPIPSITMLPGERYVFTCSTDGIIVGTFKKRRKDGGLLFDEVKRLTVAESNDRVELVHPQHLIGIDWWTHRSIPLLPYSELLHLEAELPMRLLFPKRKR